MSVMAATNEWIPNEYDPMMMLNEPIMTNYYFNQLPTESFLPNVSFNQFTNETLLPFDVPTFNTINETIDVSSPQSDENTSQQIFKQEDQTQLEQDQQFSTGSTLIPIVEANIQGLQDVKVVQGPPINLVELSKQLLVACIDGNTDELKILLAKGAPITTDWLGTSPLHYASLNGHEETTEVLIKAGCSVDGKTKVDKTPLHFAATEGRSNVIEILLKAGAEVDSKDMLMMTPLHWAVQKGHSECVEIFIKYGSNVLLPNKFGKIPLEIARNEHRADICDLLQTADQIRATALLESGVKPVSDPITVAATRSIIEDFQEPFTDLDLNDLEDILTSPQGPALHDQEQRKEGPGENLFLQRGIRLKQEKVEENAKRTASSGNSSPINEILQNGITTSVSLSTSISPLVATTSIAAATSMKGGGCSQGLLNTTSVGTFAGKVKSKPILAKANLSVPYILSHTTSTNTANGVQQGVNRNAFSVNGNKKDTKMIKLTPEQLAAIRKVVVAGKNGVTETLENQVYTSINVNNKLQPIQQPLNGQMIIHEKELNNKLSQQPLNGQKQIIIQGKELSNKILLQQPLNGQKQIIIGGKELNNKLISQQPLNGQKQIILQSKVGQQNPASSQKVIRIIRLPSTNNINNSNTQSLGTSTVSLPSAILNGTKAAGTTSPKNKEGDALSGASSRPSNIFDLNSLKSTTLNTSNGISTTANYLATIPSNFHSVKDYMINESTNLLFRNSNPNVTTTISITDKREETRKALKRKLEEIESMSEELHRKKEEADKLKRELEESERMLTLV